MIRITSMIFCALISFDAVGENSRTTDLPPAALRDRGQRPVAVVRYRSFPSRIEYGRTEEPSCSFRFSDPYFGYLTDSTYALERKSLVNFTCVGAADGTVDQGWATFDNKLGRWQTNLDPDEVAELKRTIRLYQLQAVNSTGWAVTVHDVIGPEDTRGRTLHYCLIRPPLALCGEGDMGRLQDGLKADLTPYALKILRSIEFLDNPVAAPQTDPASAASSSSR